jgi:hypothetical protein
MDHSQMLSRLNNLNDELYRVRTNQQAAAHALDCLRQDLGLDLIQQEHPMDTYKRIKALFDL